jgi:hypothetical protein
MLSGFAIRHPGQRRVPLLVAHNNRVEYIIHFYSRATPRPDTRGVSLCLISSVRMLLSCAVLYYMLDAQLFLRPQHVSNRV